MEISKNSVWVYVGLEQDVLNSGVCRGQWHQLLDDKNATVKLDGQEGGWHEYNYPPMWVRETDFDKYLG